MKTITRLLARAIHTLSKVPPTQFTLSHVYVCQDGVDHGGAAYWLSKDTFFKSLGLAFERVGAVYFRGEYMGERRSLQQVFELDAEAAAMLFGERRKDEEDRRSDLLVCLGRINRYMDLLEQRA